MKIDIPAWVPFAIQLYGRIFTATHNTLIMIVYLINDNNILVSRNKNHKFRTYRKYSYYNGTEAQHKNQFGYETKLRLWQELLTKLKFWRDTALKDRGHCPEDFRCLLSPSTYSGWILLAGHICTCMQQNLSPPTRWRVSCLQKRSLLQSLQKVLAVWVSPNRLYWWLQDPRYCRWCLHTPPWPRKQCPQSCPGDWEGRPCCSWRRVWRGRTWWGFAAWRWCRCRRACCCCTDASPWVCHRLAPRPNWCSTLRTPFCRMLCRICRVSL